MGLAELNALIERRCRAEEFQEYLACLGAAATYNVNRPKQARFIEAKDLMRVHPAEGSNRLVQEPMRYARPGERPPSRFARGVSDGVIDRFDAWRGSRNG